MAFPKPKPQVSSAFTIPAPTGGLNAFNPISNMPETDAIVMRNFFPEPFGCRVRKGYRQHATGLDGAVGTIMRYYSNTGASKVFSVDQSQIVDITVAGDFTGATPVAPSTNPWWQYTIMSNPSGTHLIAFNGVDNGFLYDDTGYHPLVLGATVGTDYEWVGVDPVNLVQPVVHQKRIWAVEKETTLAWYLPPEQLWGQATSFNFGANFNRGGFLQAICTYTVDSGYGPDDYLLAISSSGEVAMYAGIDPNDPNNWKLVGVFFVGATFTRRCWAKFGGDVALLTQYGMVTMNSVLKPADDSVLNNALSQKIQYLINEVITEGSYRAGWTISAYPTSNFVLINVPGVVPEQTFQLIYNTLTKAWTIFEGMHAYCWTTFNETLAYGGDGVAYRAWEGDLDNVPVDGEGGDKITAECQTAFSYFQQPGANKHFKMVRPTMLYAGQFNYRVSANMDFDFSTLPAPAAFTSGIHGVWNSSLWDTDATWSGGSQSDKQWISVIGIGYAAAVRISIESSSEIVWVSTDWLAEKGGVV